jgi:hypothetical protein
MDTQEEDAELVFLRDDLGLSIGEIAVRLNIRPQAVMIRLAELMASGVRAEKAADPTALQGGPSDKPAADAGAVSKPAEDAQHRAPLAADNLAQPAR